MNSTSTITAQLALKSQRIGETSNRPLTNGIIIAIN